MANMTKKEREELMRGRMLANQIEIMKALMILMARSGHVGYLADDLKIAVDASEGFFR